MKVLHLIRLAVVSIFLSSITSLSAAPWAVMTDPPRGRIVTLDLSTTPATVYGPFLEGQLGNTNGLTLDVAVTPDGQTALISNFGDSSVYRVNISNPTNPVVTGCR